MEFVKWILMIGLLLIVMVVGELISPLHIMGSVFSSPTDLSVSKDWFDNTYKVALTNLGAHATMMMINISSDSESLIFTPQDYVSDTMSPGNTRYTEFNASIRNKIPGTYNFVIHTYIGNNSTWREVASVNETLIQ